MEDVHRPRELRQTPARQACQPKRAVHSQKRAIERQMRRWWSDTSDRLLVPQQGELIEHVRGGTVVDYVKHLAHARQWYRQPRRKERSQGNRSQRRVCCFQRSRTLWILYTAGQSPVISSRAYALPGYLLLRGWSLMVSSSSW